MIKRILITGAEGFIGSHLVELLYAKGYDLRCMIQYNSFNSLGWLDSLPFRDNLELRLGDVRDHKLCLEMTKGVDAVIHLASLIGIPYSYVAPSSYIETNVTGTQNICEAALANNVSRIIHTSTSEVYGTAIYVPIDETHPLQPQSPYSASKIAADAIAMSYHNSFELPLIVARPFNTYGPRQSQRAIIPTIINQILAGCDSIKLGNLTPTRNLNYVADTCAGFKALLESSDAVVGEVVNIGSEDEISVGDLAVKIASMMSTDVKIIEDTVRIRKKDSEVYRLSCNATKLKKLTGYSTETSLQRGLAETINWFVNNYKVDAKRASTYTV